LGTFSSHPIRRTWDPSIGIGQSLEEPDFQHERLCWFPWHHPFTRSDECPESFVTRAAAARSGGMSARRAISRTAHQNASSELPPRFFGDNAISLTPHYQRGLSICCRPPAQSRIWGIRDASRTRLARASARASTAFFVRTVGNAPLRLGGIGVARAPANFGFRKRVDIGNLVRSVCDRPILRPIESTSTMPDYGWLAIGGRLTSVATPATKGRLYPYGIPAIQLFHQLELRHTPRPAIEIGNSSGNSHTLCRSPGAHGA